MNAPTLSPWASPILTTRGEPVYRGRVFALGSDTTVPTYEYERHVEERDGRQVSTHVTSDLSGAIQIAESAAHSADYALASYTLHTNQLGESGGIEVLGDQVSFRLTGGTRPRTRVERQPGAVVVGPTLIGYMLHRFEAIERGTTLRVRLAVLDRLETIGFDLRAVEAAAEQTRVKMSASSLLIGLLVAPLYFTFETSTKKLLRLEGRVPPKIRRGNGWSDFDARVEYDFISARYR